jgi:hypothetical protein
MIGGNSTELSDFAADIVNLALARILGLIHATQPSILKRVVIYLGSPFPSTHPKSVFLNPTSSLVHQAMS